MSDEVKIDNLIMRVFLETTESIVGPNGLRSILNYGGLKQYIDYLPPDNDELEIPVEHLYNLYRSINEMFGDNGAYTLKLRVGRENVRRGLEKRPTIAKAMRVASRLLPETRRMRLGLERLMEYMDRGSSAHSEEPNVELREEEDCFIIIQRKNLESDGLKSARPMCGVALGIIEALMEWITGHPHEVKEIECRAMGFSADVFRISKTRKEEN